MMKDIYKGELVRLSALDPEEFGKAYSRWDRDSELSRYHMFSIGHLYSPEKKKTDLEKEIEEGSNAGFVFSIRTLDGDKFIGDIGYFVINWSARDAIVGLAIGDRAYWGKGYGTDVMRVALRHAFIETNLNRMTLIVFEYNPRAIRSYEKVGFRHEGRLRKAMNMDGKRWDAIHMGILREEWMEKYM